MNEVQKKRRCPSTKPPATKLKRENFNEISAMTPKPSSTQRGIATILSLMLLCTLGVPSSGALIGKAWLREEYDYIIAGMGTAGSVLASRLSDDPNVKVLVVERGFDVTDDPTTAVPTVNTVIPTTRTLSLLPVETIVHKEPGLSYDPYTYYGDANGGGPSISGSFFGRGTPSQFDGIAEELGDPDYTYANLLPYFKRSESVRVEDSASEDRGRDGPIQITFLDPNDTFVHPYQQKQSIAFGNAAVGRDYATSNGTKGIWPMQRSLARGEPCGPTSGPCQRQSSYACYVKPYLDSRPNLHVLDQSVAVSIIWASSHFGTPRAKGLRVLLGPLGTVDIRAKEEVIVSLGTVNTPKFLMLSGVGPADALLERGIPVKVDLPGVGKNYRDHGVIQFAYYLHDTAKVEVPTSVRISFFASGQSPQVDVDIEIAWGLLPSGDDHGVLVGFIVQVHGATNGSLSLRSTNPMERVDLTMGFDLNKLGPMRWGLRKVREWMAGYYEILPGLNRIPATATDAEINAYLSTTVASWYHAMGTAKMGKPTDPMAVVDSHFRVLGTRNLRVVDSSVMPDVIQTHPSGTVTMLAERCAQYIKDGE